MIRLIQRRLIIPQGDTGSFTIPTQGTIEVGDVILFAIYDPIYQKTVLSKKLIINAENLANMSEMFEINFTHDDTKDLEPRKYNWDITIYHSPIYDDNDQLIDAAEINSYYAPFSLPICEIKRVAQVV